MMGWFKSRDDSEQQRVNEEVRRLLGDDRIANAFKVRIDPTQSELNRSVGSRPRDSWANPPKPRSFDS
ncbi:hypothetical protein JT358_08990 [Micrococcales bacterium 31B]|nr:hypothetical protein [Micrococcales bacterium 31B]